jgi:hypothetical protein
LECFGSGAKVTKGWIGWIMFNLLNSSGSARSSVMWCSCVAPQDSSCRGMPPKRCCCTTTRALECIGNALGRFDIESINSHIVKREQWFDMIWWCFWDLLVAFLLLQPRQ